MTRIARCHCGQVEVTCEGDHYPIFLCHCELCQRRTGAPLQTSAWFDSTNVSIKGESRTFTRTSGDKGMAVTYNFCPICGTSVWWPGGDQGPFKDKLGIAAGCFADPDFPAPTHSLYEKRKHPWIEAPSGAICAFESLAPEDLKKL